MVLETIFSDLYDVKLKSYLRNLTKNYIFLLNKTSDLNAKEEVYKRIQDIGKCVDDYKHDSALLKYEISTVNCEEYE